MTKANQLYTGSATIFIPPGKKYVFQADVSTTKLTDQDGMPLDFKSKSPGVINVTSKSGHWCIDYQETNHHPSDEVPYEQPLESPPPIMDRMRAMIYEEFANRYGAHSEEVETLEEAMDFDLNDDGHIGSPYEIPEDEFIEEVLTPAEPPAQPASEPVTESGQQTSSTESA
jgi:hypothetical protein